MTNLEKLLRIIMQEIDEEETDKEETEKDNSAKVAAEKTYEIYNEFVEAGFSDEQAFELTTILMRKVI